MSGLSTRLLAALVAVAVPLAGCGRDAPEEVESVAVVPVRTAQVATGTIRGLIHATGVVTPAPGAELLVVAPEAARIAEIPHGEGEPVRRGDLLVRFDIPSLVADVQRQEAEGRRARAAVATAEAALIRARDLFERGVAARREVEEAERQLADAQAGLAQAEASVQAASTVAERSVVRASFDGVVTRRYHNPGDLVEPSAGDPVLRVVDPGRLEVVAAVPLAQAGRVTRGAQAHLVSAPAGAAGVEMTVLSRPAAVEIGTATVPVRLSLGASAALPVNAPVEVAIDAEEHTGLIVPGRAIVREGDETAVMVVAGNTATRQTVTLGLSQDGLVEVVAGLHAGDQVVVEGQTGLPDGATVEASPAGDEAGSDKGPAR